MIKIIHITIIYCSSPTPPWVSFAESGALPLLQSFLKDYLPVRQKSLSQLPLLLKLSYSRPCRRYQDALKKGSRGFDGCQLLPRRSGRTIVVSSSAQGRSLGVCSSQRRGCSADKHGTVAEFLSFWVRKWSSLPSIWGSSRRVAVFLQSTHPPRCSCGRYRRK